VIDAFFSLVPFSCSPLRPFSEAKSVRLAMALRTVRPANALYFVRDETVEAINTTDDSVKVAGWTGEERKRSLKPSSDERHGSVITWRCPYVDQGHSFRTRTYG
jgi:hypothetical protein